MSERDREIVAQGFWWKPEAEDQKITGTAKYGYNDGIEVDLIGALTDQIDFASLQSRTTFWGVGVNGTLFTLFDAFQTNGTIHMPGCATSKLQAFQGVVGGHYNMASGFRFCQLPVGPFVDFDFFKLEGCFAHGDERCRSQAKQYDRWQVFDN